MSDYGITYDNLVNAFPVALLDTSDGYVKSALVKTTAKALVKNYEDVFFAHIYGRIDKLPEDLLDILAVDFNIEWYQKDATIEQKRNMIKSNFEVQRHLGTKYAVQLVMNMLYENAVVQEWFEYDGEPYHYRIRISQTNSSVSVDDEFLNKLRKWLRYYANVRSVLDTVSFVGSLRGNLYTGAFVGHVRKTALMLKTGPYSIDADGNLTFTGLNATVVNDNITIDDVETVTVDADGDLILGGIT